MKIGDKVIVVNDGWYLMHDGIFNGEIGIVTNNARFVGEVDVYFPRKKIKVIGAFETHYKIIGG